jgi:hypothetical protein
MWSDSEAPYKGDHYQLGRTLNSPQNLQRPRPYLIIGGGGEKTLAVFTTLPPLMAPTSNECPAKGTLPESSACPRIMPCLPPTGSPDDAQPPRATPARALAAQVMATQPPRAVLPIT